MQNTDKDYRSQRALKDRRKRRMRAKKRKRKRQIISLSLLALIIIFIVTRIVSCANKNKDISHSPSLMWYYANATHKDRPIQIFYGPDELSNQILEPMRKLKDEYIVEGSNHLRKVDKYAYDTETISRFIQEDSNDLNKKVVFLTFDDGPNTKITPQILDTLKRENARATFFLVGKSINKNHEEVMREMLKNGNAIATHSYSHNYSILYPGRNANATNILEEVNKSNERLKEIFGNSFHSGVFRYPGGKMSWNNIEMSNNLLAENNIHWIDWNTLTGDAQPKSDRPTTTAGQVEYVNKSLNKNKSTNIAVVLSHDAINKRLTADSLSSVIKYFRDNGYEFGILK